MAKLGGKRCHPHSEGAPLRWREPPIAFRAPKRSKSRGRHRSWRRCKLLRQVNEGGVTVGSECRACKRILLDGRRNGAKLAMHARCCRDAERGARVKVWEPCAALKKLKKPMLSLVDKRRSLDNPEKSGRLQRSGRLMASISDALAQIEEGSDFMEDDEEEKEAEAGKGGLLGDKLTSKQLRDFPKEVAKRLVTAAKSLSMARDPAFARFFAARGRPGLLQKLPSRSFVSSELLDELHEERKEKAGRVINVGLRAGRGAAVFDGWASVRGESIVNFLLKLSSGPVARLASINAGPKKCGADRRAQMVEGAMKERGGMEKIAAVTSDSASACVNARKQASNQHPKVAHSNDQAHAADLLMKDFGKMRWIKDALQVCKLIVNGARSRSKLLHRFRELKMQRSKDLKEQQRARSNEKNHAIHQMRPAKELAKASETRFARAERAIESVALAKQALRRLVEQVGFGKNLWPAVSAESAAARKSLANCINCAHNFSMLSEVAAIFALCRKCLRLWGKSNCIISSAYGETMKLEARLSRLAANEFLTEGRKQQLMQVFNNRACGSASGRARVKLIAPIHYATCMLDPNRRPSPAQIGSLLPAFHLHLRNCAGVTAESRLHPQGKAGNDEARHLVSIMLSQLSKHQEILAEARLEGIWAMAQGFKRDPCAWWAVGLPVDLKELRDFARRALSASPSMRDVERSLSAQGSIRAKARSRLLDEKALKSMLARFSSRALDQKENEALDNKLKLGMQSRVGDDEASASDSYSGSGDGLAAEGDADDGDADDPDESDGPDDPDDVDDAGEDASDDEESSFRW